MNWKRFSSLLRIIALAGIYYGVSRLSLLLAFEHGQASPVWPPAGIALAAVLIFGYSIAPGVLIGAFLANFTTGLPWAAAVMVSMGNMLEALAGGYLLHRTENFQPDLKRIKDILNLVGRAGILSTLISATVGVTAMTLVGKSSGLDNEINWLTWWIGDAMGIIVVTPLLLAWAAQYFHKKFHNGSYWLELGFLIVILFPVSLFIFQSRVNWSILIYPFVVWAAMRLEPAGTSLVVFVISILGTAFTVQGIGPFSEGSNNTNLINVVVFSGVASLTGLTLAAIVSERKQTDDSLRWAKHDLELRIEERTADLAQTNQQLQHELMERQQAEYALKLNEEKYYEVVQHQGDGLGIVDQDENFVFANPAAERVFGTAAGDLVGRNLREFTSPEAFTMINKQTLRRREGNSDQYELAITRLDSVPRVIAVTATPRRDANGQFIGSYGIFRDITEQRAILEREQKRMRELEALRETMTDISSELELPKLLQKIVERMIVLLEADEADLMLYDPATNDLEVVVSYNQEKDYRHTRLKMGEGLCGWVALNRQSKIVDDYSSWEQRSPSFLVSNPVTYMGGPLLAGHKILGALSVGAQPGKRRFTVEDIHLMEMFAQQTAVAIENAHLFSEVQRLATQDPLTGLYNRRFFFSQAEKEMERSIRYRHPLSLIMMDIDHFKRINDTYGHQIGDIVLEKLARSCQIILRSVDIIGRYGGEEFVVLLAETELSEALKVAERLRFDIERMETLTNGDEVVRITLSVGVAALPTENDMTLEKLLDRADQAMYVSKHDGRNRVTAWQAENLKTE